MKPYVKQYDENGILTNPVGTIKNQGKNRSARRFDKQKNRFRGNHKGVSLTIIPGSKEHGPKKYIRHIQVINLESGSKRRIEHYLPR